METSQGMTAWFDKLGLDPFIGITALVVLGYGILGAIFTLRRTDDKARVALITFVGAPLVLGGMILLVVFFPPYAYMLIRFVFIVLAILIPPSLFFLFIATRRESLFNAYTSNLDRLGLLGPRRLSSAETTGGRPVESEASRRRRIKSYLDRFAAAYGTLKPEFVDKFLDATAAEDVAKADAREIAWVPAETAFEMKTILPIIGATVLITLGWFTTLPIAFDMPDSLKPLADPYGFKWFNTLVLPIFSPVNFAFLGAYFFSLQMLIRRFVRRDLGPNAYNAVSLRIFLATMGVWVIAQALGETAKSKEFLVVAFAVGAFPDIVWQFVASTFKKFPGVGWALPSLKSGIPLNMIDGLTVWHEARLEEEDIENVHNLATVDVVDLFLNTKFPPHRIVDWIDQAILLTYLGPDPQDGGAVDKASYAKLRRFGLRTATIFVQGWESTKSASNEGSLFRGFDAGFTDEQKREYLAVAAAIRTSSNFPLMQTWRGLDEVAQAGPVKEVPQLRTVG